MRACCGTALAVKVRSPFGTTGSFEMHHTGLPILEISGMLTFVACCIAYELYRMAAVDMCAIPFQPLQQAGDLTACLHARYASIRLSQEGLHQQKPNACVLCRFDKTLQKAAACVVQLTTAAERLTAACMHQGPQELLAHAGGVPL